MSSPHETSETACSGWTPRRSGVIGAGVMEVGLAAVQGSETVTIDAFDRCVVQRSSGVTLRGTA